MTRSNKFVMSPLKTRLGLALRWRFMPASYKDVNSMHRLKIVEKNKLSINQNAYLEERLNSEEHRNDAGPLSVWNIYQNGLYAVINTEDKLIGIVEASGRPICSPGWWIDKRYRGQGFGYELVEVLAEYLVNDGVTFIGNIPIQGNNQEQSSKLAIRFKNKFKELTSLSKGLS